MTILDQNDKVFQQDRPVPDPSDGAQKNDMGLDESDLKFLEKILTDSPSPPQPPPERLGLDQGNWTTIFVRPGGSNKEHLREKVFESKTHDEVLDVLSENGLEECRQDYVDYLAWRQKELEVDESPGIILQSLQSWAWFLLDYAEPTRLPYTKIGADFAGCVELIWILSPDPLLDNSENEYYGNGEGMLLLNFYPSYLNYLSILTGPYASEKRRIDLSGFIPHTMTKHIIELFRERIVDDNS